MSDPSDGPARIALQTRTLRKKQVRPAFVVEHENRHAVTGHLQDVLLCVYSTINIGRSKAGGGGNIPELYLWCWQVEACVGRRLNNCFSTAHPLRIQHHLQEERDPAGDSAVTFQ